jgi:hypothetical protein
MSKLFVNCDKCYGDVEVEQLKTFGCGQASCDDCGAELPFTNSELKTHRTAQLRKVEHPSGKSFHWACNGLNCSYESKEIKHTWKNNYPARPSFCLRCGRGGNQQADSPGACAGGPSSPDRMTISG